MALSPNYNWSEPDNSSLVKDGALAMRTLGDAIDTSVWNVGFGQAGKNKIINGDFGIWQRGTTFNNIAAGVYSTDRFQLSFDGTGATRNVTRQTFTPGTAPQAGYEGKYFLRIDQTVAGTGGTFASLVQKIEDVRTFAGQTITLSFWAKANTNVSFYNIPGIQQQFGSGGSASVTTNATGTAAALTTSWQRFNYQIAVPSISGKTIGTDGTDAVQITIRTVLNSAITIDFWGVQVEAGSIATPFQTASGGSIQGELAMCQRYYWRTTTTTIYSNHAIGYASSATAAYFMINCPIQMRVFPTSIDFTSLAAHSPGSYISGLTSVTIGDGTPRAFSVQGTGAVGLVAGASYFLSNNNNSSAYLGFSAEL
jgi:hypothetical protein